MTHVECQELLLELVYGELSGETAAAAEAHVAGCEECRAERARLSALRRRLSPLRDLEEPSPAFDARILEAARAEASLQSDGNPGPVIDMGRATEVKPLGVQPGLVDPRKQVARPGAPAASRPWRKRVLWMAPAAAAALALLATTALRTRDEAARARVRETVELRIDSEAAARAAREKAAGSPVAPPPGTVPLAPAAEAPRPAAEPGSEPARSTRASKPARAHPTPAAPAANRSVPPAAATGSGGDAPPARQAARTEDARIPERSPPVAGAPADVLGAERSAPATSTPSPESAPALPSSRPSAEAPPARAADALSAAQTEARAQEARHAANYALAAALYRKAAALHREEPKPEASTAAWDLAHAVECLAAAGLFDEARDVQRDLLQLYPAQDSAYGATQRALRTASPR